MNFTVFFIKEFVKLIIILIDFCVIGKCTLLLHQFKLPSSLEKFKLWETGEKIVQVKFSESGHKFGILDDTGRLSLYLFGNFVILKPFTVDLFCYFQFFKFLDYSMSF